MLHLQEYSLPSQEVPVQQAAEEKPSSGTETEAAPSTNDETPPSVEDKNETSEVQDTAEKSEAEETNTAAEGTPAAEEASETAEEEEAEKPEIKVCCCQKKLMVISLCSFMLMDAKCFEISIYRLKQLQQIFVSQQQIKRGTASHAMLNTTGRFCHCDS